MKQSEVLDMVHETTAPAVKKIACNMFAPFTGDDGKPCIETAVSVMMGTIDNISDRHMKRATMLAFGMLVSTFNASLEEDRNVLEHRMQQADEAEH